MARMIPGTVPPTTESGAEKRLFQILRDSLDESNTVFHSFNLLTKNPNKKFIDGEIDFIIFSPERGFLILEVKGGRVVYDGEQAKWYQNDRELEISPFKQALTSKYKLRDFFTDRMSEAPKCCFAHVVCFPDTYTEIANLPSDADPVICLTGKQLSDIATHISSIYDFHSRVKFHPLGESKVNRINELLMPHCEFGVSLRDRMGQVEQTIFRLTENQCRLLQFITRHKEALIEGCAGSGKTIMAIKKAQELATEGKDVLLLAYNRMIGEHLTSSVSDMPNITAATYHKFCRDRLNQSGKLPPETEGQDFWKQQIPEAFENLIKDNPIKYDAVIIDEGQDFLIEYWVTITELVKEGGHFYIFYDHDQNVYGTSMEFPITTKPFILQINC
ncbi:MAG: NERD domain-containing protein/DEAD/DEAH box helicase, partial [Dehalococcoidales bacterium]|nr:NERD domain-containing protein/DEAD/DEAH box helicase [Dehalococcoidales bacterium]